MENMQMEEVNKLVNEIADLIEDMPEKGESYADSVAAKTGEILDTIEATKKATTPQLQALENMKNGLKKWIR